MQLLKVTQSVTSSQNCQCRDLTQASCIVLLSLRRICAEELATLPSSSLRLWQAGRPRSLGAWHLKKVPRPVTWHSIFLCCTSTGQTKAMAPLLVYLLSIDHQASQSLRAYDMPPLWPEEIDRGHPHAPDMEVISCLLSLRPARRSSQTFSSLPPNA